MNTLDELNHFHETIVQYRKSVVEWVNSLIVSQALKDRIQDLRTELQRSYSRLERTIIHYDGSSSVVDPSSGKEENVFDIAFSRIYPQQSSKILAALDKAIAISNKVIGKLQAEGKSWNAPMKDVKKTIGQLGSGMSPEELVLLSESVAKFRSDHPHPEKVAFIMMQFGKRPAYRKIAEAIKKSLNLYGIKGVRADDKQYHDDLYYNVLTYLHGCGFGIAVFEQIEGAKFNPNVSLEVGYMLALQKNVCLLKDETIQVLHSDLIGRLYKPFDATKPTKTIPPQIEKWLSDKGFTQIAHGAGKEDELEEEEEAEIEQEKEKEKEE